MSMCVCVYVCVCVCKCVFVFVCIGFYNFVSAGVLTLCMFVAADALKSKLAALFSKAQQILPNDYVLHGCTHIYCILKD